MIRKNVLFVYSRIPSFTNAIRDYVNAFGRHSVHCIHYFDSDAGPLMMDLAAYDVIIFNYCFWARRSSLTPDLIDRVAAFDGPKIGIFQDEQDTIRWHRQHIVMMGIRGIVTVVDQDVWRAALPADYYKNLLFLRALTGYVPESQVFSDGVPLPMAQRRWFISYRGRPVPYHYGRLTREKFIIGERMREICDDRGISCNIQTKEEARLYDSAWYELIRNSRVMLGAESGTDVFDFEGDLLARIDAFLKTHPEATFEEVEEKLLSDGKKFPANQISPRLFEAISLRTGLLLFEGEYSGILFPWKHYIPLRKDFSNIDEVMEALNDIPSIEAMVERAWQDVVLSGRYSFAAYVKQVDDLMDRMRMDGRGLLPCWGLIGWRENADSQLLLQQQQSLQLPTTLPLRHFDRVPDPIFCFRINFGALQRAVMRRYESILYSPLGCRCKAFLERQPLIFSALRKGVRIMTGRR